MSFYATNYSLPAIAVPYQSLPMYGMPFPLFMPLPLLQAAVDEAQNNIMAPRPLVFAGALTAISVVSQGLIDVCKPNGQVVPTSLMLLAIANSGERKSTVENVFLGPVRAFQLQQTLIYEGQVKLWRNQISIWDAKRKAILKNIAKKSNQGQPTQDEEQLLLDHQESQPVEPKVFKLLYDDSTSEALFQGLHQNLPTAGLTSSEGSGVLGGRAFSDLSKMNTIWSGDSITVNRKTIESFELVGARLTVSIMAQETAISDYMERRGEKSRGSGLWARFLVCHPMSTQGSRFISNVTQSWEHRDHFAERVIELLQQNEILLEKSGREKRIVKFTPEASDRWQWIANAIESEIRPGGRFSDAGDHASKLADNIVRVAALFHCFERFEGGISISTLNFAVDFCFWCSDEFLRVFTPPQQEYVDAFELNNWLNRFRNSNQRYVRKNYIRQYCPNSLRQKNRLNATLELLGFQGLLSIWWAGKVAFVDLMPGLPQDPYAVQMMIQNK